jgi:2-oxoglutarate ferredoxin oxidoreductase subunit delta
VKEGGSVGREVDKHKENQVAGEQDSVASPPEKPHQEYDIDIFPDWCKSCGICAAFCPKKCITLNADGNPVVSSRERCTGCRWCELHCPDFAICIKELVEKEAKLEEVD